MRRAFDVFEAMPRQALKPNMFSCRALISACSWGQEMRRAFDVCAAMLCQALKATMVSYDAGISACEKGKELRRVLTAVRRGCAELCSLTWSATTL